MFYDEVGLYREMLRIAAEVGAPKYWRTDLTKHDRDAIAHLEPGKPHYWILRECGTNFVDSLRDARTICDIFVTRGVFKISGGFLPGCWEITEITTGSLYRKAV